MVRMRGTLLKFALNFGVVSTILLLAILSSSNATPAQQNQPLLRITSPVDGTVVNRGQTITVVATPLPGINFSKVIIIGEGPIGFSQILTTPPFQFSVTIPPDA